MDANHPSSLSLNTRDLHTHFHHRAIIEALGGAPLSHARDTITLRPSVLPADVRQVIAAASAAASFSSCVPPMRIEVFSHAGAVFSIEHSRSRCDIDVFSGKEDALSILRAAMASLAPLAFRNSSEGGVWAGFAHLTDDVVWRHRHFVPAPSWESISSNYPSSVLQRLDALMSHENPTSLGSLLIWHGPPGTGKTSAVRSLMLRWRARFEPVVITDPELFVARPSYHLDVMAGHTADMKALGQEGVDAKDLECGDQARLPRLFILEDCADLIMASSRSAHFDKVGKLLNLTDGLVGQGRGDVFLLTFNEHLEDIDPAFLRPGRCIMDIEFTRHSQADATAWLEARGCSAAAPPRGLSLAELFAVARGVALPAPRRIATLGISPSGLR